MKVWNKDKLYAEQLSAQLTGVISNLLVKHIDSEENQSYNACQGESIFSNFIHIFASKRGKLKPSTCKYRSVQ